jgi:hypothetical protein
MAEQSIYQQGKAAGLGGSPRSSNPYRKGVPGMSILLDELATEWENGHIAGSQQYMAELVTHRLFQCRDGFNADNLD